MTGQLTDEGLDTIPVLAVLLMCDWCVVSEWMLVTIMSVSLDSRKILWAQAALALSPLW